MTLVKKGDLIYLPAETMLYQYNREVENLEFDPSKSYIGPAPVKYKRLEKPASVLVADSKKKNGNLYTILHDGQYWHVQDKDIMT